MNTGGAAKSLWRMGVAPHERTANLSELRDIHSGIIELCGRPDQNQSKKIIHPSNAGMCSTGGSFRLLTVAVPLQHSSVRSQSVGLAMTPFIMCSFILNYFTIRIQ
jgi:hypothetical protein